MNYPLFLGHGIVISYFFNNFKFVKYLFLNKNRLTMQYEHLQNMLFRMLSYESERVILFF